MRESLAPELRRRFDWRTANALSSLRALRGPLHRLTESLGLIPGLDEETLAPELRREGAHDRVIPPDSALRGSSG